MITVKQLIEKLEQFPPDWGVEITDLSYEYGGGDIINVREANTIDCDSEGNQFVKGLQVVEILIES